MNGTTDAELVALKEELEGVKRTHVFELATIKGLREDPTNQDVKLEDLQFLYDQHQHKLSVRDQLYFLYVQREG